MEQCDVRKLASKKGGFAVEWQGRETGKREKKNSSRAQKNKQTTFFESNDERVVAESGWCSVASSVRFL